MNERIKDLAEQAGFVLWQDEPWRPTDVIDWSSRYDDELKKFAELIVRECCQELWTEDCHTSDLAYLDYKNKINKIKRHFGVEE